MAISTQTTEISLAAMEASETTDALFPEVYRELRAIAGQLMAMERLEHTLSATALVNETYLRLGLRGGTQQWDSRGHFFAAAAEAMRRILIDAARSKSTAKRKGVRQWVDLDRLACDQSDNCDWLIDLDHALSRLAFEDAEAAEFAKLRFFAGLNNIDAGKALGMSKWSAYRTWEFIVSWFAVNHD